MCFVLSWKARFEAMWVVAVLSQNTISQNTKSLSSWTSQETSLTVVAKPLSASANDFKSVTCFFDFQETDESPRNTQKLVVDLQVSRQEAQSSLKARIWKIDAFKKRPWPGVAAKVFLTWIQNSSVALEWRY